MTIRLLSTYDGFAPQSILTLDPAIESALIADGNASATLTGGTVAYRERPPVLIQPAVQKHGSVALIANRKAIVPMSEGTLLTITPTAGTTGTYQRYDSAGAAVGALTALTAATLTVGSFEGDSTVEIKCTTGTMAVKVRDAATSAAQFVSNTDGGQTLSVGGVTVANLRPPIATLRVAAAGDSISEPWVQYVGNGTSVVSPGIVRMTFAAAFTSGVFWPGDKVKTSLCSVRAANQMDATITAIDTVSRLWVEYTTTSAQEHSATGAGYIIFTKYALWGSGYVANACAQAGIPFSIAFDAAISGGDSSQVNEVLARNITDCDVGFYGPGMNDVYLRGFTFAQIKANDTANLALLKPRCRKLVVLSIPARNSASGQWTTGKLAVWRQVNEFRRQWCVANGAVYVDLSAAEIGGKTYCDPLNTNNDNFATGTSQVSSDYIHPIGLGGVVLGAAVARTLKDVIVSDFLPASSNVAAVDGYMVLNPLLVRTSGASVSGAATFQNLAGAASPEVANGFTISADQVSGSGVIVKCGVVARTKAVHGDSMGNAQRIIIDNTAGGIAAIVTFQTPSFAGSLVDGDTLEYGCHMLYSAMATPGSGDPTGLLAGGTRVQELHTSGAPSRYNDALSLNPGTGVLPGHSVSLYKADKLRTVADAGAFNTVRGFTTVQVAAGQSACVDIGRVLYRRALSL